MRNNTYLGHVWSGKFNCSINRRVMVEPCLRCDHCGMMENPDAKVDSQAERSDPGKGSGTADTVWQ